MANYNNTSLSDALKKLYTPKRSLDLITGDNPLLKFFEKDTTLAGEGAVCPIRVSIAPTASRSITQASTNANGTAGPLVKSFLVTGAFDHTWKVVDHETILKTETQEGSYWNALKMAVEEAQIELGDRLEHGLFRGGWGSIGVIESIDGATIRLTKVGAVRAFAKDLEVQFASTESSSALRNSGGSLKVASVDFATGDVTFTANVSTLAAVAVGDHIFVKGDRDDSATPTRLGMAGLETYGPSDRVPANDSLFGVNRYADSRMQFCRVQGKLSDIAGAMRAGAMQVASFGRGIKTDEFFCSYNTLEQLEANTSSQIVRSDKDTDHKLNVGKLSIITPNGIVPITPARHCQDNVIWGLKKDTFKLFSSGPLVRLYNEDSLDMTRNSTNGIEVRYFTYSNLACYMPGANVRIDLD